RGPCVAELTRFEGHHGEAGSGVRDVVMGVGAQRPGEPAARLALVALEPGDAAENGRVIGGDTGLPEHVDDQAGGIAVAGSVLVVGGAVVALPVAERGEAPAAVRALQVAKFL